MTSASSRRSEASFSGDASGGVLTVTDGTHTAHIHLAGDYTASTFVAASDGHGGTIVTDPPRADAFASAMAQLASAPALASNALEPSPTASPTLLHPHG